MAQDMGISITDGCSFLAEDSVIDLELLEDLNEIKIPSKCSINDLKNVISKVDLICINDEEVLQLSQCNDLQQAVQKILKM